MTDPLRQQEIAFALGRKLRAAADAKMQAVNDELAEERARRHRLIDEDLATELKSLRQRCQAGSLSEADLKS